MASYTLNLLNMVAAFNGTQKIQDSKGFVFKCNGLKYIITTHHFFPIIGVFLNHEGKNVVLKKYKNIYWNDLNILEYFPVDNKVVKSFRTKFEKKNNKIKMEIDNKEEKFIVNDYFFPPKGFKLRNTYMRFFINDTDLSKYKGLSGSPVFSEDDRLIGVFVGYMTENEIIYGLVLPTIYILKTLQKRDNTNIYKIEHDNFENIKIGNYEVSDSHIYHPGIKYKIPIEVFYNLEGDVNKYIELKNIITKEKTSKMFIPKNNFDININLIKDGDYYKPNAGLLSMLSMHNLESKIREIFPSTF